jgi:glycosyltransferase involved in cell wall biosynthesis
VLHEVTGLLVPPKVDAALTSALLRLLGDAPLRDKLGAAGRERVRVELNWRRFTEQTLKAAGWGDA